ncbi:MAG TPA: TonB-dependent receptor [Gammaproteobacteria bacterium]|nr:TonB-dependent receptor [Gammaproteobacteria bacterium]
MIRPVTIFVCLAGAVPLAARGEATLSEQDFLGEVPVVLSATRLAQPLTDAPAAITVIDREMIEASGARDIPDLFRLVPGFLVGHDDGHTAAVSYHMLNEVYSRRMQVLVDGRSVYTPSFGGVPWSDLPLSIDDIERIEVIRGPNAATYGSNSFLGIISIITRHPALQPTGMLRANAGTNDIHDGTARYVGHGTNLDYRITTGYRADGGFPSRHDSTQARYLSLRGDYRFGLYDTLRVEAGASDNDLQEDTTFDPTDYPPHTKQTESHFEQLRWRHSVSTAREFSVQFYHNYHNTRDEVLTLPIAALGGLQLPISYSYRSERYDLELQDIFSPAPNTRLVWGASTRRDEVISPAYLNTNEPIRNVTNRIFGNLEWRKPHFTVNAGAMWENNDFSGASVSPRLAINYHLTPRHTVRLSASRATRTPVTIEDYGNQVNAVGPIRDVGLYGPRNLKAETIDSYELGYVGQLGGGLDIDAKLYRDELKHLITYETVTPFPGDTFNNEAPVFGNYDQARIMGFETGVNYRPTPADRLVVAYAYTDIWSTDNSSEVQYSHAAPFNTLSTLYLHRFTGQYMGSIAFYYTGKMQAWDSLSFRPPTKRLDLRLAKEFHVGATHGQAAFVVQHAWQEDVGIKLQNISPLTVYASVKLDIP